METAVPLPSQVGQKGVTQLSTWQERKTGTLLPEMGHRLPKLPSPFNNWKLYGYQVHTFRVQTFRNLTATG